MSDRAGVEPGGRANGPERRSGPPVGEPPDHRLRSGRPFVPAVIDVSFDVAAGETLCLVGESGSGKSLTALSIMRLVQTPGPHRRAATIRLHSGARPADACPSARCSDVRGAEIGLIFQEPMTALNPVFTIGNQIEETLRIHGRATRAQRARRRRSSCWRRSACPSPSAASREYPHQLSGGLRQRALIALALACEPALLIADEPTTALDVTIQAQILDLLRDLQQKMGLALLLITHDLGVVAEMADRVAVMYAGRIVEEAPVELLFSDPKHPYTRGLMASMPGGDTGRTAEGDSGNRAARSVSCRPAARSRRAAPNASSPCATAPPEDDARLPQRTDR